MVRFHFDDTNSFFPQTVIYLSHYAMFFLVMLRFFLNMIFFLPKSAAFISPSQTIMNRCLDGSVGGRVDQRFRVRWAG